MEDIFFQSGFYFNSIMVSSHYFTGHDSFAILRAYWSSKGETDLICICIKSSFHWCATFKFFNLYHFFCILLQVSNISTFLSTFGFYPLFQVFNWRNYVSQLKFDLFLLSVADFNSGRITWHKGERETTFTTWIVVII